MSLPENTGLLDQNLGYVVPKDTSTWSDTTSTSWANFATWNLVPANPLIWCAEIIDQGSVQDFNLLISASYDGTIAYDIYVSNTGFFLGEETVTSITDEQTDIPAFNGRYVAVVAKVYKESNLNILRSLRITAQRKYFDILHTDIVSSSLSGVASGRILPIGRTVSKVLTVDLIGRAPQGPGYTVTGYIADDYFESTGLYIAEDYFVADYITTTGFNTLSLPFLVSKDRTGPVVCLCDQNGNYIEGEFDARITVLPEQYMSNGQLLTR